jgi:hypothetical protein
MGTTLNGSGRGTDAPARVETPPAMPGPDLPTATQGSDPAPPRERSEPDPSVRESTEIARDFVCLDCGFTTTRFLHTCPVCGMREFKRTNPSDLGDDETAEDEAIDDLASLTASANPLVPR